MDPRRNPTPESQLEGPKSKHKVPSLTAMGYLDPLHGYEVEEPANMVRGSPDVRKGAGQWDISSAGHFILRPTDDETWPLRNNRRNGAPILKLSGMKLAN